MKIIILIMLIMGLLTGIKSQDKPSPVSAEEQALVVDSLMRKTENPEKIFA